MALQQKRPELVKHYNARPQTSLVTRQKFLELNWDALPHPPYSPDIAPSEYHLFRPLQYSSAEKTFTSGNNVNTRPKDIFESL